MTQPNDTANVPQLIHGDFGVLVRSLVQTASSSSTPTPTPMPVPSPAPKP